MSAGLQIGLIFLMFIVLLCAGMYVPFAIAIPAVVYLLLQGGIPALNSIGLVSWGSMNSFTLSAIPLYLLMAEILQASRISDRVYRGLATLFARVPGGLLQTNIAGCAVFSAICGSSIATAATIGRVALPQLEQRKYDKRLSAGSLAAGGTLGILIPPSIVMIIYGTFTDTSVAKLFMAGVVPGLLLAGLFMAYIALHSVVRKDSAPRDPARIGLRRIVLSLVEVFPIVLLIGGTMAAIYAGWVTPTEAAAGGCAGALVIGKFFGKLTLQDVVLAMNRTILVVGNILLIVYAAFIFSVAISFAGVGEDITQWVVNLKLTKIEFFLAVFLLYTLLGCLVEAVGMIVITVPLLFPILVAYGIDPIWFGVVLVLFIEMGAISPPIGINLFVIQGLWKGRMSDVVYGTIPFHLLMFVLLGMLLAWPRIALWLPGQIIQAH